MAREKTTSEEHEAKSGTSATSGGAVFVALGILASRTIGVVRERVFAHYFGNSLAADAFKAAIRIPNVLQNLFGEGVLSASFIPVYSGLLADGKRKEAASLAAALFALLTFVTSLIVALGVWATPFLIDLITPGFSGERRELTIRLTRIFFPGVGLLVLSAWCLGILNSHRRFFLPYVAPVVWNVVVILSLLLYGDRYFEADLAVIAAWGAVVGSLGQLLIQLPSAVRALPAAPALFFPESGLGTVLRNFFPVFIGRGVVQISAYLDSVIASLLPLGAVSSLSYAQTIYLLPISLFGMSISAAELPAMAQVRGEEGEIAAALRLRLSRGLRHIAFFVIPSAIGFFVLGRWIIGAVFQTGRFTATDTDYVWLVLAVSSVGLLSGTLARLYSSTFYALKDPRTPLRFSLIRVIVSIAAGAFGALALPDLLGISPSWGLPGLVGGSALATITEYLLLKHALGRRIGATGLPGRFLVQCFGAAGGASGLALGISTVLPPFGGPLVGAIAVLGIYGISYLVIASLLEVQEAQQAWGRVLRRRRRS